MKSIIKILGLFLVLTNLAFTQTLLHPVNLDFENSEEGLIPFGWNFQNQFEKLGYEASSYRNDVYQGKYSLIMKSKYSDYRLIPNPDNKELQSVIYQEISAEYFRGKEIFFGIKYKIINPDDKNTALIFIQQENNDYKFFRLFTSDTLRNSDWTETSIKINIDSTAKVIKFGLISFASAEVLFDDAIINFNYDFTKNKKPVVFTEIVHKNLFDLAKVYGTVKYFYPSPYLKDFPWDALLYDQIDKAVTLDQTRFLKNLKSTFEEIAKNDSKSSSNVKSASNFVYTGIPIKTPTPFSSQKISDIFITNKEYPGTLINFVNLVNNKPEKVILSVKYKHKPFAKNSKGGLWLRFDNAQTGSISEHKSDEFVLNSKKWETAVISADVPSEAVSIRIGLVLEGDGEILFDDLTLIGVNSESKKEFDIRNGKFELPFVNNYISGWNFPQHSINAGFQIEISTDAFEGKQSIKIFSDSEKLINYPEVNSAFTEKLSDGSIFQVPITVPITSLSNFTKKKYTIPENFSQNFEDSYSRLALIIEFWNHLRHFSFNTIKSQTLENGFLNAIFDANKATSLNQIQNVLLNLSKIANDPNLKIWYGFDLPLFFPNFGFFVSKNKVFAIQSDSIGIPSGSEIIKIDNNSIDSLIKISLILNKDNTINNNYIIYKEVSNLLSGINNSSKEIVYNNSGTNYTKKIFLTELALKQITKPLFATEIEPGIIYFNSARISDEEFKQVLPKLQDKSVKGIIIDLRGYSLLSEHILGLFTADPLTGFISEIPIYTAPDHTLISYSIMHNGIKSIPKLTDKKLIFLINEFSTSYSEIIAALARLNKVGKVIGTPTQGNITEIEQISLPSYFFGSQSILKIRLEGQSEYLRNSVAPEHKVEQTLQSSIKDIDDQLEEAKKLIR